METTTGSPPPCTAEAEPTSPQQLRDPPSNAPPETHELQPPPDSINSITELKSFSAAITAFQQCYDELQKHLDSIKAAILPKLNLETLNVTSLLPSGGDLPNLAKEKRVPKQQEEEEYNPKSELEILCKMMCSRDLKKYLVVNLSDLPRLREEVPKALKLAPNPSKLVFDCLGRFFLQGSKAYTKDSPMIPAREASVLILECFLLMMGMDGDDNEAPVIGKEVKEEAEQVALAWRKRLVSEGGVAKASEIDARGLLLLICCFGILDLFKREDIKDLVMAGNAKEVLGLLQKSRALMNKIPEIVEWMIKNKIELDAIDLVYTFVLEQRFDPQTILISFLRESKETGKRIKKTAQGSATAMLEANKKQLARLRSVVKCLERHKIDPTKLLPGWQISQKISTLEKEIANLDRKSVERTGNKRKTTEIEMSKRSKIPEAKRLHFTALGPQQKAIIGHVDSRKIMLDSGLPSHVYNYSASPSIMYGGPGAGLLPENMQPPGVGAEISANRGGVLSTGSYAGVHGAYAGVHGEMPVDMHIGSYAGVHGGMPVDMHGQVINPGNQPYSWHADAALIEKYTGQSSAVGLTSLYRASTSVEGFPGVLNASNTGLSIQNSASNLYQFADSVVESQPYQSQSVGAVSNAVPAHHSSHFY